MSRRVLTLLAASLFVAGTAAAATSGFSSTLEEFGFLYPPVDTPLVADFAAPVGTFQILTPGVATISTNDPVNGPLPCDPTTTRAIVGDTSIGSFEARYAFPMAAGGDRIIQDKAELGAQTGHSFGLEFGVYSYLTKRTETIVQFGPNWEVLVYGKPVDIGGSNLTYNSLWDNDCLAGIDNHLTVVTFHDMRSATVRVELTTHGTGSMTYVLGPFLAQPETAAEGIGGMFTRAPRDVGRTYVDAMVCVGNVPVILPSRGETGPKPHRDRY